MRMIGLGPRGRGYSHPLECELRDTPAGEAKTADSQAARATQTSRQLFSTCVHVEPHGSRLGQKAGKNALGRVVEERETHPRSKRRRTKESSAAVCFHPREVNNKIREPSQLSHAGSHLVCSAPPRLSIWVL